MVYLESQKENTKCEKCSYDDDFFIKCVNCRKYFHLRCSLPTDEIEDNEFAILKDKVARYDWKCFRCKMCYICNRANSLVLSCIKCNRWMHIKCRKGAKEYIYKNDSDFKFVECQACTPQKQNN